MINRKELLNFVIFSFLIALIVLIFTSGSLIISIRTSLSLTMLFLLPGYLISSIIKEINVLERYVLSILIGFSYTSVYFLLEVLFNLKLTPALFLIIPGLIYSYFIIKYFFITKKPKEEI